jgi:hypothetical protein
VLPWQRASRWFSAKRAIQASAPIDGSSTKNAKNRRIPADSAWGKYQAILPRSRSLAKSPPSPALPNRAGLSHFSVAGPRIAPGWPGCLRHTECPTKRVPDGERAAGHRHALWPEAGELHQAASDSRGPPPPVCYPETSSSFAVFPGRPCLGWSRKKLPLTVKKNSPRSRPLVGRCGSTPTRCLHFPPKD